MPLSYHPVAARPAPLPAGLAELERTAVMGICNLTPDSFSDGGRWLEPAAALAHCQRMLAEGADLIDLGGESTRPGAARISLDEELRRVVPMVGELAGRGVAVSVDTMRAAVAAAAAAAGAAVINDVSGGLADPEMFRVMAEADLPVVLTHWRGHSDQMDRLDAYGDVVAEVEAELAGRVEAALAAGIAPGRIVLDPGFGFAKTGDSNWPLLARLDRLEELGFPLLIGASRKRFLNAVRGPDPRLAARGPAGRDAATAAVTALSAAAGVWCVRVHAVAANAAAVRVAAQAARAVEMPSQTANDPAAGKPDRQTSAGRRDGSMIA
ncbi:MAG: dihydropteroate synthase [Bifidobacteriaceae bacterium]|jgi:dihydropteroate synthase|nr:dihydropteroate synthase [Bifidobacteriaceae bacterium]